MKVQPYSIGLDYGIHTGPGYGMHTRSEYGIHTKPDYGIHTVQYKAEIWTTVPTGSLYSRINDQNHNRISFAIQAATVNVPFHAILDRTRDPRLLFECQIYRVVLLDQCHGLLCPMVPWPLGSVGPFAVLYPPYSLWLQVGRHVCLFCDRKIQAWFHEYYHMCSPSAE